MAVDFRNFKEVAPAERNAGKKIMRNTADSSGYAPNLAWWDKGGDEAGLLDSVTEMIGTLSTNLYSRMIRYRTETRLYGISDFFALLGTGYTNNNYNTSQVLPDRLTFNVVQSNIDTLVSRTSKIKPRARFLTTAGTFGAQKSAKKLSYFSDGIFQENKLYDTARSAIRDCLVVGDGFIHAYEENGRVRLERVMPYEILVDEMECVGSPEPTHMYRVKLVDRGALIKLYPQLAEKIAYSSQLFTLNIHNLSPSTDQIEVLEAYHLESFEGAGDGRHIIAVPNCILLNEEWKSKRFPYARLSWTSAFAGYWSQSLAEQLKSTQLEINKLLAVMQRSYHLAGSFKILVQNGSQISNEAFSNQIGSVIKFVGQKPEYITPPIMPPEFYNQIDTLIQRSYRISGISELSAYSQKPAGLNSGVAIREYNDIESARFLEFSQDIESWFVEIAQICMDKARLIAEKNGGHYPITRPNAKSLDRFDLKEIQLKEDDYTITVFPASSLPNEPAGRLQAIEDLTQRGLIDATEQRELLNMPDIEANNQLSVAQDEYLKSIFENFIQEKVYVAPDPMDNLQLARKLCLQYYALAKTYEEGEDTLELFRMYMSDLNALEAPQPVIPQLPQAELGAMASEAELSQLALPAATGPLPAAESAVALGQAAAGLPPTALA